MTREEIDELIEYLEKNYYVECSYKVHHDELGKLEVLRVSPILRLNFNNKYINKDIITNKLDKLDLIRF